MDIKINIADSLNYGFMVKLMTDDLIFLGKQAIDKNKIDGDYMVFDGDDSRINAIKDILRNKNIRVI